MLLRSLRRNFIGIFKRLPFHMCLSLLNSYNEKSIVHFVRFANALLKHFEYLKANNERCLFTTVCLKLIAKLSPTNMYVTFMQENESKGRQFFKSGYRENQALLVR